VYLKILVEQGIVGIFIFFIIILMFIRQGWRLYQKGDDDFSKSVGLGFVFLVLVLLVNNIFGERWSHAQVSAFLWVIAGLVARLNILVDEKSSEVQMVSTPIKTKKGTSHTYRRKKMY
jgi:O-antigen ligase